MHPSDVSPVHLDLAGWGIVAILGYAVVLIAVLIAMILLAIVFGLLGFSDLVGIDILGGIIAILGASLVFAVAAGYVADALVGVALAGLVMRGENTSRWRELAVLAAGAAVVVILSFAADRRAVDQAGRHPARARRHPPRVEGASGNGRSGRAGWMGPATRNAADAADTRHLSDMTENSAGPCGFVVEATRDLDAPPTVAWRSWTDPADLRRWWGPTGFTCPRADLDVRVGGTSLVSMSAPDWGFPEMFSAWENTLVQEPDRLEFVFRFVDADGNPVDETGRPSGVPAEVAHTITLDALPGNRTLMRVHEAGYASAEPLEMSQAHSALRRR